MKQLAILLTFVFGLSSYAAIPEAKQRALLQNYDHTYDIRDFSGQTFLSFMREVIKPAMDEIATEGYVVAGPDVIAKVYKSSDKKVQNVVNRSGGIENVKQIAAELEGKVVTLDSLPGEIAKVDRSVNRYKLSTFLGLASGGGVVLKLYDNNYAYNVHYDTTEQRSGRSFGAGPVRLANDASDKAYLDDIQDYFTESKDNLGDFYRTLLQALLASDTSNYENVNDFGQTLLTDFLAVYTAEQARNLMDGHVHAHWDAALLEVTLLASFHAGQTNFKLFYYSPETQKTEFTDRVLKQSPCALPEKTEAAGMHDYWQFSRQIDNQEHCRRSGINITKREFRKLSKEISLYMLENYPQVTERLKDSMGLRGRKVSNLYNALSKLLINDKAPASFAADEVAEMTEAWVDFLTIVTEEADNITTVIEQKN